MFLSDIVRDLKDVTHFAFTYCCCLCKLGSDDDVVKLYDLTALCDSTTASDENPFTVPISMLLYRVARNMWTNFRHRKAPVIRTLLENCLFLLDREKHSQVRVTII